MKILAFALFFSVSISSCLSLSIEALTHDADVTGEIKSFNISKSVTDECGKPSDFKNAINFKPSIKKYNKENCKAELHKKCPDIQFGCALCSSDSDNCISVYLKCDEKMYKGDTCSGLTIAHIFAILITAIISLFVVTAVAYFIYRKIRGS